MNIAFVGWLILRILRWLLWIALIVYSAHFILFRDSHIDPYGHLFLSTEVTIFGLIQAAVFAGFLELMMRERAGRARPAFGRDWAPDEARRY